MLETVNRQLTLGTTLFSSQHSLLLCATPSLLAKVNYIIALSFVHLKKKLHHLQRCTGHHKTFLALNNTTE